MFRVILAIAVAVFPAFGLAQMLVDPVRINPMWVRFAFSITAAILLVSTYRWERVRTRISQLTSIYLCIVSYWYVGIRRRDLLSGACGRSWTHARSIRRPRRR